MKRKEEIYLGVLRLNPNANRITSVAMHADHGSIHTSLDVDCLGKLDVFWINVFKNKCDLNLIFEFLIKNRLMGNVT